MAKEEKETHLPMKKVKALVLWPFSVRLNLGGIPCDVLGGFICVVPHPYFGPNKGALPGTDDRISFGPAFVHCARA